METVLFVDDNRFTLTVIRDLFRTEGINILTAEDAAQALEIVHRTDVAVVVSDNVMPGMSGLDFLTSLKDHSPDTVKILMSAFADLPSALAAINCSEVFRYVVKPWQDEEMLGAVRDGLKRYQLRKSMRNEDEDILRSLAQTIELKDPSTRGHCDRVAIYALRLAKALDLPKDLQREIKYGSWLHDCGKIGISELILNGTQKLNEEEFETVKQHSLWGADVAEKAHLSTVTRNIIAYHHERYDGSGYPAGLMGEQIPLEARIVTIADVFDALSTDRPYRSGFSREASLAEMRTLRGTSLDPQLLDLFLTIMTEESESATTNQPVAAAN
ncbi:MAG TPA: HD domain-containing phosphohydrolase [Geobacteraceae bacterium]